MQDIVIVQIQSHFLTVAVVGVILQETQHILGVDVADAIVIIHSVDVQVDAVLQQSVAIGGLNFGDGVIVVFHTLDDDLTKLVAAGNRIEDGCVSFLSNMASYVVHALSVITGSGQPVTVSLIPDLELDVLVHTGVFSGLCVNIGEELGQVHAEAINVAVVDQGVVVIAGGSTPGQNDLIAVAVLTIHEGSIGVDGSGVGHAHSVIGVASVQLAVDVLTVIQGNSFFKLNTIDLCQTDFSYVDGHMTIVAGVSDSETAVILNPCSHFIGAVGVGEELDLDILQSLVVCQAGTDSVIEVVGGQAGRLGGNGGQSGQDLIFHHVAGRTSGIVFETVVDVVSAVVLTGVLDSLTNGLLQGGNASLILGVYDDIVVPEVAALGRSGLNITGNSGHRQGYEEGIGGAGNHFGYAILNDQVQADGQVPLDGLTVVVGQIHVQSGGMAVDVGFQGILNNSGVVSQSRSHCLVQDIRLVEPELIGIILGQCHGLCAGPSCHVVSILITAFAIG